MKRLYDLLGQLFEVRVFSGLIHDRVIFQKSVVGILYGYSTFSAISFRVIDAWSSEFLTIGLLYLCSVLSGFSLSSVFWLILGATLGIQYSGNAGILLQSCVISQYYSALFEDLYSRKCRGCLYSDYCSVNLRALPIVLHILIGIIPPLSSLCSIYPLSKLRGRNFL